MKNFTMKTAGSLLLTGIMFMSLCMVTTAQENQINQQTNIKQITDVSGTWVGTRYQYDRTRSQYIASFEYIFEIEQSGSVITGSSYIKNSNEDFAEIKLRGKVVGDKLHFEEYAVMDQKKPNHKVWCFKVGELNIGLEEGITTLKGVTNSFMSGYYLPCTGGFTSLERIDDYQTQYVGSNKEDKDALLAEIENAGDNFVTVYPNPYVDKAQITYTLMSESEVQLKIYALDGREVVQLVNELQQASEYNFEFDGKEFGFTSGAFIVELNVNGNVHSQQLIQVGD